MQPAAVQRSCKPRAWRWREVARLPAVPGSATQAIDAIAARRSRQQRRARRHRLAPRTRACCWAARRTASPTAVGHRDAHATPSATWTAMAGSSWSASHRTDGPAARPAAGTKPYHWQAFRPRAATATGDQRINSFGIGGEVEVRAGLHVQKQLIASPDRPRRPRRGDAQRRRAHHLAERHPAVGVRRQTADATVAADAAPQGIVPVAVRVERPRDGVRHRPDLAIAARPAHQRAGDGGRRR